MGRASGDFGWGRKLEQCQGCDGVDLGAERDGRQIDKEIRVVIGKREGPSGSPRGGKHLGRRHAIEQKIYGTSFPAKASWKSSEPITAGNCGSTCSSPAALSARG